MANNFTGVFGGYTNVTEVVSADAKTAINANIDKFLALFPALGSGYEGNGVPSPHTDFDHIYAPTLEKIRNEITALKAAIAAAPTS